MPERRKNAVSGSTSMVAGSLSGLVVSVATQPLDVARTMLQRDPKHFLQPMNLSTWTSWTEIARSNGYTALWRGNVPSMLRVGMGTGM
jgi:hypothetical protein